MFKIITDEVVLDFEIEMAQLNNDLKSMKRSASKNQLDLNKYKEALQSKASIGLDFTDKFKETIKNSEHLPSCFKQASNV